MTSSDSPAPNSAPERPTDSGRSERRASQLGIALVALGALALLANLGVLGGLDGFFAGVLFAAAGVFFVRRYRVNRNTWALPVGFGLFALAAAAIADGPLSGTYFLGLLGAGFVAIHWDDRRRWWALIPGGILITLGIVAAIDELLPLLDAGPVLFLGIAATFFWLTRLEQTPQPWAIYPALGALAVGILSLSFTGGWLFPLLLLGAGVWLLRGGDASRIRELLGRRSDATRAPAAEPAPESAPGEAPAAPATAAMTAGMTGASGDAAEPAEAAGADDATDATDAFDAEPAEAPEAEAHGDDDEDRAPSQT